MSSNKQLSASQAEAVRKHKRRESLAAGSKLAQRKRSQSASGGARSAAKSPFVGVGPLLKGGVRKMSKSQPPTVRDMERVLGLNGIEAIQVSPGMRSTMNSDSEDLQKWYEEELREVYAAYERE